MLQLATLRDNMNLYNVDGSYYYLKLKTEIAKDLIITMTVQGNIYIDNTLESVRVLSARYNIPKSSLSRALINLENDGWIERIGSHGRGVKYQILISPKRAEDFLASLPSLLKTKKLRKKVRRGTKGTIGMKYIPRPEWL